MPTKKEFDGLLAQFASVSGALPELGKSAASPEGRAQAQLTANGAIVQSIGGLLDHKAAALEERPATAQLGEEAKVTEGAAGRVDQKISALHEAMGAKGAAGQVETNTAIQNTGRKIDLPGSWLTVQFRAVLGDETEEKEKEGALEEGRAAKRAKLLGDLKDLL